MDSGLGVQWPLSPCATALAAGALVALFVALWNHRTYRARQGTGTDPSGRKYGSDLERKSKEEVDDKDKEDSERTTNFPVPTPGDVKPGGSLESSSSPGRFGAIPKTAQKCHTLQYTNLYSALRKRNVEKGGRNWHEINPPSNFSCIYQQSFFFGNEVPKLNARFVLNVSPYLNQYLRQFCQLREQQLPELFATKGDFENFDVSINPEILKDKPITRSAVCLTLERQLRKILSGEPLEEVKSSERAVQTDAISEERESVGVVAREESGHKIHWEFKCDTDNDINTKLVSEEDSKKICATSSLWDSGYCDKSFDERSGSPKDSDNQKSSEIIPAYCGKFSDTSSDASDAIDIRKHITSPSGKSRDDFLDSNILLGGSNVDTGSESAFYKSVDTFGDSINVSHDLNYDKNVLFPESFANLISEETMDKAMDADISISAEGNRVGTTDEDVPGSAPISSATDNENEKDSAICISTENSEVCDAKEPSKSLYLSCQNPDLELLQETSPSLEKEGRRESDDGNLFLDSENIPTIEKNGDRATRASGVDAGIGEGADKLTTHSTPHFENSNLERIQKAILFLDSGKGSEDLALPAALRAADEKYYESFRESDVTRNDSSRDPGVVLYAERETPRQMDRETGERSVAVESTVRTETTLRDSRLSTAVVSRVTLEDWTADREDSVSVKTTVSEEVFRPTFEEFVPLKSGVKIETAKRDGDELPPFETREKRGRSDSLPTSPRVDRLKGLLSRDEERRSKTKFQHLADDVGHVGGAAMEGEWDRLLRDVLASVSELERWERRECDVRSDAEDAEEERHPPFPQSDSPSFAMEEEALSPGNKGETPTKVKNLRFKLDPDVFDVPSDDSFYDDDDDEVRRGWKRQQQSRYRAFSSLELHDEPVRLVSVHASVVPAGQKMVARPVGIDLRVRLTEERQSKRAHVSTSPSQAKRRSPVSDRGWFQELSPVTENVDWRETFTPVTPECKSVPNGILKTPSPKVEPLPLESPNPFKLENGVTTNGATTNGVTTNGVTTNGVTTNGVNPVIEKKRVDKPKYNGLPWRPTERKPLSLPRKKFEPDPEAIERITGYKTALSKPPLPPPVFDRIYANKMAAIKKAELARKQYLDNRAALTATKVDGTQKFQQFVSQAQTDRARIVTSVPDLVAIERAVSEQWMKERATVSPRESPGREDCVKADDVILSRGSTPDDKWASYVQSCRQHLGRRSQSMTYLETDIDIIPILDDDDKCVSSGHLDEVDEALPPDPDDSDLERSREDLDDSGRAKSEHELRIERSLRSMPVPEWYRRSEKTKTGFLLGSSVKEKRGWAAAKSLASSTSSLASCGLRRPVRSLRSSRENIPWSRSSASPDGPTLSLALAKAFREPYLGWRARTPTSSGVSSSPRASPPSWGATTTDDEANGVSFDGEDAFGRTTSSEEDRRDEPLSLDDTGADAVTVSMDTNDPVKIPGGEDTCDDINNMSMDTCELFDAASVVEVPVDEDPSPQADTGDDIDNLSTDTTTTEGRKLDPKLKRYSYSQSIYHSEWEEEEASRGDRKAKEEESSTSPAPASPPDHKVVWIESSFVGSRTTTSILVLPQESDMKIQGSTQERPASR